jgi:glycerophosphoryl diester phosphodiesterase
MNNVKLNASGVSYLITIVIFNVILLASCSIPAHQNYFLEQRNLSELQAMFRYSAESVYPLSSHRGGPEEHLPENCIETFENTLKYTYSMMECDPRYTKDSFIVLHHDRTLDRTTTGHGLISDFTLEELNKLNLKDQQGNVTPYRIPTLDSALEWAKRKTILVLDKKDVPIEERIRKVVEHKAEANAIVMAYSFAEAKRGYALNENIMMQIFVNSHEKIMEFEETGVPWKNVVVFVGHQKPADPAIFDLIHQKGALCIMGTSRNLDREYLKGTITDIVELKDDYQALLGKGVDIIETDIPVALSRIISNKEHRKMNHQVFR